MIQEEIQKCIYCGQRNPDKKVGYDWYHSSCWEKMPANGIFPKEFRRHTAQEHLDKALKPHIKDGRFIL